MGIAMLKCLVRTGIRARCPSNPWNVCTGIITFRPMLFLLGFLSEVISAQDQSRMVVFANEAK